MSAVARNEKYLSVAQVCERFSISRATFWNWMKKDQTFPVPVTINKRHYFSEYDLAKWEAHRGGADPDLNGRLVGLKPVSGVITDYRQLVEALIKRRDELKISSIELDARSGMQEGYTSKLENYGRPQGRGMGPEVFPLWLGGLKCGVVLVDLPRRPRAKKQDLMGGKRA
ncbi:helix-turn-helix domain-containing protein [Rhizobiaceae bacterium n13]|uniref:helix-turn-helix transcriptional regulator n=1 Tax=Ferirhizobium litorale TaxID=2927786 RepID=UPI0024B29E63|nr:helix-turn-helix domain-containing protein [Fererhizobium litorale]MDI7862554.1 helix-turn-helix domain-containing protein [Fererhizobium litorale]